MLEKESAAAEIKKIGELYNWISGYFLKLMGVIESHVMASIYRHFDGLFRACKKKSFVI